jgi:citrate synthase
VRRGADLYDQGRYVEADEVFERSEPRVAGAPLEQQATYAVYRGATFVALGDLQHAQRWLTMASEIEHSQPGTLRAEDRAFLDVAWQTLAKRMPSLPSTLTTAVASSSQAPSPSLGQSAPSAPPPHVTQ